MEKIVITNARYMVDPYTNENVSIIADFDGKIIGVPLATKNRHYKEIMRQVEAGTLTIAPADSEGS